MTEKEISEIRRRFRPDKSAIARVRGCFVNERGELLSQFSQSLGMMTQEESESLLITLRKTLSGTQGKNLLDIVFETKQVVDSDAHRLLMALRDSGLNDEGAVQALFQRISQSVSMEGNYLILLARDAYDVPYRSRDGEKQADASSEVFNYILCSICPVKLTKAALSFQVQENEFHNLKPDWVVSPPEMGFMFPAFNDRAADLYGALYYTRDIEDDHAAFVNTVFQQEPPMPAAAQRETFDAILGETLEEDCSLQVVQAVHEQMRDLITAHKENPDLEPLAVDKRTVRTVLQNCGVPEARTAAFEERYDAAFGGETALSPKNLVDTAQVQLRTPDVTIRVNPERGDLVQTRIIDGAKYILIRADEGVEVEGVSIHISE